MKKYLVMLLTIFIFMGLFGCDSKGSLSSSESTVGYTNIYEFGVINEWTGETEQGMDEEDSSM